MLFAIWTTMRSSDRTRSRRAAPPASIAADTIYRHQHAVVSRLLTRPQSHTGTGYRLLPPSWLPALTYIAHRVQTPASVAWRLPDTIAQVQTQYARCRKGCAHLRMGHIHTLHGPVLRS